MSRQLAVAVALVLLVLSWFAVASPAQTPPSFGDWCGLEITAHNRARHVYGSVNTECSGGCFFYQHSVPFGNWGTYSAFGAAQDSDQYKGWQGIDYPCGSNLDDPEWNSCTASYPGPGWPYYNEPYGENATTQYSPDTVHVGSYYDWYTTSEENGCAFLNEAYYGFPAPVFSIYELDPFSSGTHVADVSFGQTGVTLTCDREGCLSTSSSWINSDANATTSAQLQLTVRGFLCLDGKGCR